MAVSRIALTNNWSTESMSLSRQQRVAIAHHGLHLVPNTGAHIRKLRSGVAYRIATVAAALFLAMTVC